MVYLIIATESRGALLDRFLSDVQPFNYSYETDLVVIGGATIKKLSTNIIECVDSLLDNRVFYDDIFVLLAAGICNLTSMSEDRAQIVLSDPQNKEQDQLLEEMEDLYSKLASRNVTLKVASIPPVSLAKYEQYKLSKKVDIIDPITILKYMNQQQKLEHSIMTINDKITKFNSSHGIRTSHLHKDLIKINKKRRKNKIVTHTKFDYSNLYDGVHGNQYICYTWYSALCHSTISDIENGLIGGQHESDSTISEDDVIEEGDNDEYKDSWDFKRK